jgi:hypothetical protein
MQSGEWLLVSQTKREVSAGVKFVQANGTSMLIRPDGCIVWTDASVKTVDEALKRWF